MAMMQLTATISVTFAIITLVTAGKKHHGDDSHVGYKFGYGVHDPHTHDIKTHHEERHGKHVVGFYKLKQPDGTTRVVHYKAGPHSGFKADVQIIGHPHHHHHHDHGHGHNHKKGHGKHKDHGHGGHHHHYQASHGYAVHEPEDVARYLGPRHHEEQQDEEDDEY